MAGITRIPDVLAPDLIIKNGKIVTVDKDFSFAEAVVIKDGKIVYAGSAGEADALRGVTTRTLNLRGKTLIPGINDSHVHLLLGFNSMPPKFYYVGPEVADTIGGIREIIKDAVSKAKPGQWIDGGGWNQGTIKELMADHSRTLSKADFDDITSDNPMYLAEFSYHTGVANSAALKAAGIDRNTPDPVGGKIVRNASGEPTGMLLETANDLVIKIKPAATYQEMRQLFEANISELTKYGITSVTSANDRPFDVNFFSNLYRDYAKEGKPFPLRIGLMLLWADSITGGSLERVSEALKCVGTTTGFGNDFLRIAGIKIFADGIPPAKTAWSSRPYEDGSHGSLVLSGNNDAERIEHLSKIVELVHSQGYQLSFHTTGDLAVKEAVKAFARILDEEGAQNDLRHYVIHGDWVLPESMDLMAQYGIALNTQSELLFAIGDDTVQRFGIEDAGEQWCLKTLMNKGVKFCNSSDWPCASPDWRVGMQAAVTRKTRAGVVCGAHNAINIEEAIRSYTTDAAWFDHMEDRKGSIEAGCLADFAVLGEDITVIDPDKIQDIPIHMSIVGGNIVYSDGVLNIE